ncbi:muscle M-line assembly protein unc-89-like isoform X28 [Engraulis encrasicolus]|uniref:muscle M-line assembly protein unc-89-like isoform X28 n=1 Tax=Engraulis encrasicolus TaxID=184585 RepID=UPI002FD513C7
MEHLKKNVDAWAANKKKHQCLSHVWDSAVLLVEKLNALNWHPVLLVKPHRTAKMLTPEGQNTNGEVCLRNIHEIYKLMVEDTPLGPGTTAPPPPPGPAMDTQGEETPNSNPIDLDNTEEEFILNLIPIEISHLSGQEDGIEEAAPTNKEDGIEEAAPTKKVRKRRAPLKAQQPKEDGIEEAAPTNKEDGIEEAAPTKKVRKRRAPLKAQQPKEDGIEEAAPTNKEDGIEEAAPTNKVRKRRAPLKAQQPKEDGIEEAAPTNKVRKRRAPLKAQQPKEDGIEEAAPTNKDGIEEAAPTKKVRKRRAPLKAQQPKVRKRRAPLSHRVGVKEDDEKTRQDRQPPGLHGYRSSK